MERKLIWRITGRRNGTDTYEAEPVYERAEDAIAAVQKAVAMGKYESALIEDHNGKRVEWNELKEKLKPLK